MKAAFTLIELSMVLVIIGLLIGGILVGKDLIKSSENRAYVSQLVKYTAAVNTFKTKYNCLPGDCANITDYGFTNNGDGNGMVSGLSTQPSWSNADYTINQSDTSVSSYTSWLNIEADYFWKHLRSASLIPEYTNMLEVADGAGTKISLTPAKNDGTFILATGWNGKHYYKSGAVASRVAGNIIWSANFTPADAAYIFDKMGGTTITTTSVHGNLYPDGLGRYRVFVSNSANSWCFSGICYDTLFYRFQSQGTGGATSDVCIDTSVTPAYFNLKNTKKLCALIIQADF